MMRYKEHCKECKEKDDESKIIEKIMANDHHGDINWDVPGGECGRSSFVKYV